MWYQKSKTGEENITYLDLLLATVFCSMKKKKKKEETVIILSCFLYMQHIKFTSFQLPAFAKAPERLYEKIYIC